MTEFLMLAGLVGFMGVALFWVIAGVNWFHQAVQSESRDFSPQEIQRAERETELYRKRVRERVDTLITEARR